jgi:hypothetical protein
MPEALTESFCERCGTRYEFKAPTKLNPLRKTRGLVSGLRNYIMSQDALSDAMGDAMRSEEDALAARQLEAFHSSFNFCIDCRQYTCLSCWNDAVGRCRTCAPIAGTDDLIERMEASFQATHPELASSATVLDPPGASDLEAWPSTDLVPAANGHIDVEWPAEELIGYEATPEPELEPEWVTDIEPELEVEPITAIEPSPVSADEADPDAVPVVAFEADEPRVAEEPEPAAAWIESATEPEIAPEPTIAWVEPEPEPEPSPVLLTWEEDEAFDLLPEPVVAYEPEPEPEPQPVVAYESEPEPEPQPVVAYEPEPEPEPQPVVAYEPEAEPEPEPAVAYEPEPEPDPEPEPEPVIETPPAPRPITSISETILRRPEPPRIDEDLVAARSDDPEVAARRAQLDLLGLGDPGQGPVAAERPTVLPYRSSGAAARPNTPRLAEVGSFWDASAREVAGGLSQVAVQSCTSCGLSLSASARFCRRCGTRQAQPA